MRTDTTIYRPRVRQRQSPRRIALRRAVFLTAVVVLLAVLVGLAFAGSRTTLAAGHDDRGRRRRRPSRGRGRPDALGARGGGRADAGHLHRRRSAVRADRLAARGRGRLAQAPSAAARRGRRLRAAARLQAPAGAALRRRRLAAGRVLRRGRRLQARPDRRRRRSAAASTRGSCARGSRCASSRAGPAGSSTAPPPRPPSSQALAASSAARRSRSRSRRPSPSVERRRPRGGGDAGAHGSLGAARASPTARRAGACRAGGSRRCSRCRRAAARRLDRGAREAEEYLERLSATVSRKPQDARFQVTATGKIVIRPSAPGLQLDMPATAKAIAAAAFSTDRRTAKLVVRVAEPERTTEIAKTMGITGVVSSYTTTYGGTPGRLNNVQLVARADRRHADRAGRRRSRSTARPASAPAEKGFQEAPVIINGELQNGLGGGICQVSTTVFNAAFEAGLPITARTNHALYISHYPLGRDATVNYPDLDLRFSTTRTAGCSLRTFVGAGSLTVNLYGTPVNRRVESTTAPLVETGPCPSRRPTIRRSRRASGSSTSSARRRAQTSVQPARLRRERQAAVRQHLAVVLRRRAVARARRHEGAAEEAGAKPKAARAGAGRDDAGHDDAGPAAPADDAAEPTRHDARSALATASANHGGHARRLQRRRVDHRVERLGRRDGSPSRSIRYSYRKRAPRMSTHRTWIVSTSSKPRRRGSRRAPRSSAPRSPVPGSTGSRRRGRRGRRPARPRARRRRRVVRDALRVRLGEAHAHLVGAPESLRHRATIRGRVPVPRGGMTGHARSDEDPEATTAT